MSSDREFEDFLKRRRPLFHRDVDDGLEPPAELDRIVLRQARDAIQEDQPLRLFNMPRWAAPVAIAATLVLGLSVVFKTGLRHDPQRVPEVKVESVAQRVDHPPAPLPVAAPGAPSEVPMHTSNEPAGGAVIVELGPPMGKTGEAAPRVASAEVPTWRRDARTWQAEIQRLRANGDKARADAEQAEFNREYRAYAVSPDR